MNKPTEQQNLRALVKTLNSAAWSGKSVKYTSDKYGESGHIVKAKTKSGKLAVKVCSRIFGGDLWIENADENRVVEPYPGFLVKFDSRYN